RTIAAVRADSLLMSPSLVSDPGHRASKGACTDYLDQILRNSRRDLRPPRRRLKGPCRVRTRPPRETSMIPTDLTSWALWALAAGLLALLWTSAMLLARTVDRKSTRLNSSHVSSSYAVFS